MNKEQFLEEMVEVLQTERNHNGYCFRRFRRMGFIVNYVNYGIFR